MTDPRRSLRVGMVCPYSFDVPGGVQNHVLGLARYLRQAGHRPYRAGSRRARSLSRGSRPRRTSRASVRPCQSPTTDLWPA